MRWVPVRTVKLEDLRDGLRIQSCLTDKYGIIKLVWEGRDPPTILVDWEDGTQSGPLWPHAMVNLIEVPE